MPTLRNAEKSDVEEVWNHYQRTRRESGSAGDFIFSPFEPGDSHSLEAFSKYFGDGFDKKSTELGWERMWLVIDAGEVRGHLALMHRPSLKSCLHRASLMMEIERNQRGTGLGTKLVAIALDWAKEQSHLAWIDLSVFSENTPARSLYQKFGFREIGMTKDRFRVHGCQINDVAMALQLC